MESLLLDTIFREKELSQTKITTILKWAKNYSSSFNQEILTILSSNNSSQITPKEHHF